MAAAAKVASVPSVRTPAGGPYRSLAGYGAASVQGRYALARAPGVVDHVSQIRARIPDFHSGSYIPKKLVEFLNYLAGKALSLETRVDPSGRQANYLVDARTGKSVPAAAVDARLSVAGIGKMFGITLGEIAERKAGALTAEEVRAVEIRRKLGSRVLDPTGKGPFEDWNDVKFNAPLVMGGELTACGGELWVGKEMARASTDPEVNKAIAARARAAGIRIVVPAVSREDARDGRLVPGMPILEAATATRLGLVDKSLSMSALGAAYGEGLWEHFAKLHERLGSAPAAGSAKVVDISDFQNQFVSRKRRRNPQPSAVKPVGKIVFEQNVHGDGTEKLVAKYPDGGVSVFPTTKVAEGRYVRTDTYGIPTGFVEVAADGRSYVHVDSQGRLHNEYGPAVVGYAEDGSRTEKFYENGRERQIVDPGFGFDDESAGPGARRV